MADSVHFQYCRLSIVIVCLIVVNMSGFASAQGVYKWVDKDGKVQYGDKRNAPDATKESDIKASKMPGTVGVTQAMIERGTSRGQEHHNAGLPNTSIGRGKSNLPSRVPDISHPLRTEKWPEYKTRMPTESAENKHLLELGEAALQKCISLAVNSHNLSFTPEGSAAHKVYMAHCPKVRIECNAFRREPEMNLCEPKPTDGKGPVSVFNMKN